MAYNFNNLRNLESLFWGLLDEFEAYARDVYFKLGDEDEKEVGDWLSLQKWHHTPGQKNPITDTKTSHDV